MLDFFTLNRNKDFLRLYSKGEAFVSPVLVTYIIKNKKKRAGMGITTSKKIGKAVKRNRSRRIIKESYRKVAPFLKTGCDIVFVARHKTAFVKSDKILSVMKNHLEQAGVLHEN